MKTTDYLIIKLFKKNVQNYYHLQ